MKNMTLSEIQKKLTALTAETTALQATIRQLTCTSWHEHDGQISIAIQSWAKDCDIDNFITLRRNGDQIFQSAASLPSGNHSTIDMLCWEDLMRLSVESWEVQCDFKNKMICVPLVFFDRVDLVVLSKTTVMDDVKYDLILEKSRNLLLQVRKIVVSEMSPAIPPMVLTGRAS